MKTLMKKLGKSIFLILSLAQITGSIWPDEGGTVEREAMYQSYLQFPSGVKGGWISPHWLNQGDAFWYAEGVPDKTVFYRVDPQRNAKALLFDTARLRKSIASLIGHEPPYQGVPFSDFVFTDSESKIKLSLENRDYICRLDDYKVEILPSLSEEEKSRTIPRVVRKGIMAGAPDVMELLSPDRRWFLGARNYNLCLRSTFDGRSEQLTTDGVKDYDWDVEGASWSPESFKLAAKKLDKRKVPLLPIIHWLKTQEELEWVYFTKAGGPMVQQEIFILDVLSKRQVRVDTDGEPDQYLRIIGWDRNGSELYLTRLDRICKKLEFLAADSHTGSVRRIITETSDTFLQRQIPFFLEDGKTFIWTSERDGWAHLYLYSLDGKLIRRLTQGNFPVVRVVTVDEKEGWVYFTAHAEKRLYDTHLYRVDLQGQGFKRLTEADGQHDIIPSNAAEFEYSEGIQFSPSKKFFVDNHSSTSRAPSADLRTADGRLLQVLDVADTRALDELKWGPPEEFIVKAADGKTDLYGALYKPYDFDPHKKYPVIDHIYNGPQAAVVPQTFADPLGIIPQALAQLGFIVFIVDGRGTIERGKAFQDVVYGNFGRNEIPDHVATIKQLARDRPYIDLDRAGIFGGSWGGYMTIRAMLLAPEIYKVGVGIYPVVDLYDHMASAIEMYMGLPEQNKAGYEYGSSLRLAQNLKGRLLLIHGTSDVNAPFSASMKMVEALIRAGKEFDLLVMPEQSHGISGVSLTYLLDRVRKYFQMYLSPER